MIVGSMDLAFESLVEKYGIHPVYTDGGTWYPEACKINELKHCYIHL